MNAAVNVERPETTTIFRVAIENVSALWPQIEPLVKTELASVVTHDAGDVRALLLANQMHLWVQWSGHHVEAMAVTDFVNYPRGLALRVWLGTVNPGDVLDRTTFRIRLNQWARANQCKWIDACGRVGWLRVFRDAQYTGMFMRITVDDRGVK